MTAIPVLPPLLLAAVATLLFAAQVVALRHCRGSGHSRTALWRWIGVSAAALLLVVSATRVVVTADDESATQSAGDVEPNVFLLIDRSPDMAVADLEGRTRIEVVHNDIQALIDRYPQARFAVIGFASGPSLEWPLSADSWSLKPVMDIVTPYAYGSDAVTQSNAGAANTVLRYQLISAVQQYPRARNLVFYLGAGARESRLPAREFDPPPGSVDGGAVLGYGTTTGGPIPGTDIEGSSVDDSTLRAVADQLAVPYVTRSDSAPLAAALPDGGTENEPTSSAAAAGGHTETYWVPALVAAILILIELYFVLRDFRRTRLVSVDVVP